MRKGWCKPTPSPCSCKASLSLRALQICVLNNSNLALPALCLRAAFLLLAHLVGSFFQPLFSLHSPLCNSIVSFPPELEIWKAGYPQASSFVFTPFFYRERWQSLPHVTQPRTAPMVGTSPTCRHNIPAPDTQTQQEPFLWLHSATPPRLCIPSWAAFLFGSPWLYLTRSPNCLHWFYRRLILKAAQ